MKRLDESVYLFRLFGELFFIDLELEFVGSDGNCETDVVRIRILT